MAAVGTLTIEMAANVARLQRDMERATKTVGGAMDRIRRSVDTATRAMGALTAAFAAYKTIQGIIQQADAMTLLNSRLQLVTKSQEEFVRVQGALISISQRSYTNLQATVDLYTALSRATANIGISQNELLRVVETFNKSIIISGGSVQAAEAAITQFNQAMASGVLRGEEFNSISEQAPMIMEILANSLGVTRGALRDMAKEGLLVAELVLPALLEGSKGVDAQFQQLNKTIGQSGVQFKNQFALLIDELNKLTGGTSGASRALDGLTFNLEILTNLLRALNGPAETFNETQAETARLLRQNEEAAKANNEAVASSARAMLERQKADELAKKAADELKKSYDQLLKTLREDIRGSTAALQAEQQGLNQAQEDFLKLVSSPQWSQYTEAQRMLVTELYKQRIETEKLIDAEKERAKAAEARLKKMLDDEKEFMDELKKEDEKRAADKLKKEQEFFDEQKKQIQQIEDQLTDALMRAFESGKGFGQAFKDTLVNMFRTMVLRPVLAPISGAFASAFAPSAIAGTAGGMSGSMGFLGGLAAASGALGTGIAAGFTNALSLNFAGSLQAAGSLIGTGALSGIAAGAGMIAGTLLPIVGAVSLIKSLTGGDGKDPTGMGAFVTTRGVNIDRELVAATTGFKISSNVVGDFFDRANEQLKPAVQTIVDGILDRTQDRARAIGLEIALGIDAGLVADPAAKSSFGYASVFIGNQEVENFVNRRLGPDFEKATIAFTEQLQESIAKAVLDAGNIVIPAGQTATAVLERLGSSILAVNNTFETLGLSLYETSIAGAEMAAALVDLLGGVENFTMLSAQYYQDFYTEAERTEILTRQLTASFGELGLSLPETRDAFRELVEAQDLTTESGRQTFAGLMQLSSAFASITPSTDELNAALSEFGEIIEETESRLSVQSLQERYNLETRLLNLQGDTVTLRQREIDSLDESNRALLKQIHLLEDSAEVTRQTEELRRAIDARKYAIENERLSLEARLLNLQGNTAELRNRERESLSESNRVLLDRIFALEDEIQATEEATRAAEEHANAMREEFAESQRLTDAAFNAVRQSVEAEIARFKQTFDATDVAFSRLQRSVQSAAQTAENRITKTYERLNEVLTRQLESASIARDAAQENVSAIQSVFDVLKSNIDDLMTEVLPEMTVAQGRAFIAQALSTAQTTGYLPEQGQLSSAISAARSGLSPQSFGSSLEMRREQLRLVIQLQQLQDLTGNQLSNAELQLQAANSQVELMQQRIDDAKAQFDRNIEQNRQYYDSILEQAQSQVDVLRGVDNSVIEVSSAISLLETAIQAEENAQAQIIMLEAQLNNAQAQLNALRSINNSIIGLNSALSGFASAIRAETRAARAAATPATFAAGGLHSGGMRLVGERGPELEVTGPARYMSNATLASMMTNGNSEEIKQMREENKVQMRAMVSLQNRMTKIIEQWNGDGLPTERVEA